MTRLQQSPAVRPFMGKFVAFLSVAFRTGNDKVRWIVAAAARYRNDMIHMVLDQLLAAVIAQSFLGFNLPLNILRRMRALRLFNTGAAGSHVNLIFSWISSVKSLVLRSYAVRMILSIALLSGVSRACIIFTPVNSFFFFMLPIVTAVVFAALFCVVDTILSLVFLFLISIAQIFLMLPFGMFSAIFTTPSVKASTALAFKPVSFALKELNGSRVFIAAFSTAAHRSIHSTFTSCCLPDVLSASGGKNRCSGATLADTLIIPQGALNV